MKELFPQWAQDSTYTRINTVDELRAVFASIPQDVVISLDTETTGLDKMVDKILGFSFAWEEGKSFWVPLTDGTELQILNEFVQGRVLIFYNAGYDIPMLERHQVKVGAFEDAQILVFMENPNKHMRGLKDASLEILGLEMIELKKFFGKGVSIKFELLDPEIQTIYAAMDADATLRMWHHLSYIKDEQKKIWGLETALVRPNVRIENNGISIDVPLLRKQSQEMGDKIGELKTRIFELAGCEFSLDSPPQIAEVLYSRLRLPIKRRTDKKKAPKVDKVTLKLIENVHPIVPLIMDVSSLGAIKGGFLDTLPGRIHPLTNRIHCQFVRCHTPTGRYASMGPNLQNIPKQLDETKGVNVRDAFIVPEGYDLLDYDYSQIELRIAASLSKEPVWFNAYSGDIDVHSDTAKKIYKCVTPTKEQRSKAKTGNFGILNGQDGYSFAMKNPPMTPEEGKAFVKAWYAALPVLTQWKVEEVARSRRLGYAQTFFGRRRPMDGINSPEPKLRAYWERSVLSHIVQGTAADIMKLAIIILDKKIQETGLDIKILLTVHDELLFEVEHSILEDAKKLIVDCMEIKLNGFVPLKVEGSIGHRWGSCVEIEV